ncbi:MAG: transposase zinc-binding domain-containing protein [Desulfamplus sp.]|nr:transposase zinc-binding domain-containing protein [Desulfamplus sp.]
MTVCEINLCSYHLTPPIMYTPILYITIAAVKANAELSGTANEIFKSFGPEYLERFGDSMPHEHRKVIDAIVKCRTPESGLVIYECTECGEQHISFRSCGNRHCPACQNHKTRQWLEKQMNRQLSGHHFMITFTFPEEMRHVIRSHQQVSYAAMFKASSETMKMLSADPRHIGGDIPGFFGVLHTWGRQLQYHPHIHYIAPGGAIKSEDGTWQPSKASFYLPVMAMSKIFRAKFRDEMKIVRHYQISLPTGFPVSTSL